MVKPSYSPTSLTCIKSKFGQDIISPTKPLDRWAEYYKDLASDPSGHRSCFYRILVIDPL